MVINNFSITKKQYDNICHILTTAHSTYGTSSRRPLLEAAKYVHNIAKIPAVFDANDNSYSSTRVLTLIETIDIVKKIQSKLNYYEKAKIIHR